MGHGQVGVFLHGLGEFGDGGVSVAGLIGGGAADVFLGARLRGGGAAFSVVEQAAPYSGDRGRQSRFRRRIGRRDGQGHFRESSCEGLV